MVEADRDRVRSGAIDGHYRWSLRIKLAGLSHKLKPSVLKEWNEKVFRTRQANEPIFAYRNELFGKLPPSLATFRAGLQDAYVRVQNGYAADLFVEAMEKDIRDWAHDAPPREISQLANLLSGLGREMTGKNPKSPEYLTQVHYDSKNQKLSWEKARANFAKEKELQELIAYLNSRAQTAGPKR